MSEAVAMMPIPAGWVLMAADLVREWGGEDELLQSIIELQSTRSPESLRAYCQSLATAPNDELARTLGALALGMNLCSLIEEWLEANECEECAERESQGQKGN